MSYLRGTSQKAASDCWRVLEIPEHHPCLFPYHGHNYHMICFWRFCLGIKEDDRFCFPSLKQVLRSRLHDLFHSLLIKPRSADSLLLCSGRTLSPISKTRSSHGRIPVNVHNSGKGAGESLHVLSVLPSWTSHPRITLGPEQWVWGIEAWPGVSAGLCIPIRT